MTRRSRQLRRSRIKRDMIRAEELRFRLWASLRLLDRLWRSRPQETRIPPIDWEPQLSRSA